MPPPAPRSRPAGLRHQASNSTSMRVPTSRPGTSRAQTATPTLLGASSGRASPAESMASTKRKAPPPSDGDSEIGLEETNINVVVRCRGRSDREVKENSGVVVSTDGIKGKKVELSMGPNALSNKTYAFDKVFSPAADQGIVFDEVVSPILDEVLNGFNCTIFAYGQTGTGKTYTMSGDITDMLPIPDAAGIIPRVLHKLFDRLGDEQNEKTESSVKCSFIELYNEELRDLLAPEEGTKLKIYDEHNKSGRTTTLVAGMEETHIKTAAKGIQLLRVGSHKRQVAATKCNDLSSRSHTVFTVTVYMKRQSDSGEDFVCSGKLNLVDLAGSENIGRSGAENKRAAEAGLINKSLLTLGRVINALVDKGPHIPYRESNLTRLLQDSLGGRTKTCIIATLSPAKSNLEETISTLDYAFRAKNIRNKPQINQMVSKKTLLREFTAEIEKLKSELIATRQRNGVYLTTETYEEMTTESESRRILSEEQRDKIETMESNLKNKVNELFLLTTNFQSLKRNNEDTRRTLDDTKNVLDKTEIVLAHTKKTLTEETRLRQAHQKTEEKLAEVGEDLLSTLGTTTDHVDRLHSKLRRRSELQSINRGKWSETQRHVSSVTGTVEQRIEALRVQQQDLIANLSGRMQTYVKDELQELQTSQSFLKEKAEAFETSEREVNTQTAKAKDEMNGVLEEIRTLREDVKSKVGAGLNDLSGAAQKISAGIASELDAFHGQLQASYVSLGREFKTIFEDLIKRMYEQQAEARKLREQIVLANSAFVQAGQASQSELEKAVEEERQTAAADRASLLAKVSALVNDSAATQEARLQGHLEQANKRIKTSEDEYRTAEQNYGSGMDAWNTHAQVLIDSSVKGREAIKSKLKADWGTANEATTKLTETTNAVHGEAVRIVDGQMTQMDGQLVALDEIISRVRAQNEEHHQTHSSSLSRLAGNVQESYASIGKHFSTSYDRTKSLEDSMQERADALSRTLPALSEEGEIRRPLHELSQDMTAAAIEEYAPTGETPMKTQFSYPNVLPRTQDHDTLLRGGPRSPNKRSSPSKRTSPSKTRSSPAKSPSKTNVYTDHGHTINLPLPSVASRPQTVGSDKPSLRELDVNVTVTGASFPSSDKALEAQISKLLPPKFNRSHTHTSANLSVSQGPESKLPALRKFGAGRMTIAEGRENVAPRVADVNLSASIGPGSGGRVLRSRGSQE